MRRTSAVDVIIQEMSPDYGHQRQRGYLGRWMKGKGFCRTHLVEDVEILRKRITTGGNGAIVGNEWDVVELTQISRRGIAWGRHRDGCRNSNEACRGGCDGGDSHVGVGSRTTSTLLCGAQR